MILGMTTETFTLVHVVLSLIGILTGLYVVIQMFRGTAPETWTRVFLATTLLTSVTGFLFPFAWTPGNKIGVLSVILLAIALLARYSFQLAGAWRKTYVITAVLALYFNVFVLIVQSFLKIAALHELAPTGSEPPFAIAQVLALALFVWLGIRAVKGFRS